MNSFLISEAPEQQGFKVEIANCQPLASLKLEINPSHRHKHTKTILVVGNLIAVLVNEQWFEIWSLEGLEH